MIDEYSDIQTDQLTEIFKRAMNTVVHKRLDTRGEFTLHILREVIWELERERAIWPDVRMLFYYHTNRFRQTSFSERG